MVTSSANSRSLPTGHAWLLVAGTAPDRRKSVDVEEQHDTLFRPWVLDFPPVATVPAALNRPDRIARAQIRQAECSQRKVLFAIRDHFVCRLFGFAIARRENRSD